MILICIPLMTNDIEHSFMCLLAIYIFSLKKRLFTLSPILIGLLICLLLSCKTSLYILGASPLSDIWFFKYFLTFHRLSFHSFDSALWCIKVFNFYEVQFIYFCIYAFDVISKKLTNPRSWRSTSVFSLRKHSIKILRKHIFYYFSSYMKHLIHFYLFLYVIRSRGPNSFFCNGYPIVSASFIEETIFSPS